MDQGMKWASALMDEGPVGEMIKAGTASIRRDLGEGPIDLVFFFVSPDFQLGFEGIPPLIAQKLESRVVIGCSAGGVIGGQKERERKPALSLLAGRMPGVTITPFHLENARLPGLDASPRAWQELIKVSPSEAPQFILIADPFTFNVERLLAGLDFAYPSSVKVGGLASGGDPRARIPNTLFLNGVKPSGAVGVAMTGDVSIDTVVAQGCRPIGKPASVTEADRNLLLKLDDKPALEALQELIESLLPADQELARQSLFLGIAMTPFKEHPEKGDFLIRNLIDVDYQSCAIAVGALLQEGQTVQFHLRDAETSAEDLDLMLEEYAAHHNRREARGALLFSCLGRGEYLYGRSGHDSEMFLSRFGPVPLGGFFCNGEIGAVGGTTFLHGYTSCFGIIRPRKASKA
jgi:small ligand-binding sensory domain FIST